MAQLSLPNSFQPTAVFESYWRFAAERQRIFEKRLAGYPPPWTADPILNAHKFTTETVVPSEVGNKLRKFPKVGLAVVL
jgi:hypothetical protein